MAPARPLSRRSVAVALVLLAAACSSGSRGAATASTSAARTATTTPLPTATSSPLTTTTLARCSAPPVPAGAPASAPTTADVDGDGRPDTVTTYAVGDQPDPRSHIRLQRSGAPGGEVDAEVRDDLGLGGGQLVRVLGASSIGGPGATIFVQLGRGASTSFVGLFGLDGCTLGPVAPAGGQSALAIGGSVTHLSGVRCTGAGLEVATFASDDGQTYTGTVQAYRRAGLTLVADGPPTPRTLSADDPDFDALTSLRCDGVQPPA